MHSNLKENRIALILGASSDIGISVVEKFINKGWYVLAHANKNIKQFKKLKIYNKRFKIIRDFLLSRFFKKADF